MTTNCIYDYLLGGKDNYAADHAAAEESLRANPNGRVSCVENRAFMRVRSRPETERFFVGHDLVEPGVQSLPRWRPGGGDGQESPPADATVSCYGGLAASPRNARQVTSLEPGSCLSGCVFVVAVGG